MESAVPTDKTCSNLIDKNQTKPYGVCKPEPLIPTRSGQADGAAYHSPDFIMFLANKFRPRAIKALYGCVINYIHIERFYP